MTDQEIAAGIAARYKNTKSTDVLIIDIVSQLGSARVNGGNQALEQLADDLAENYLAPCPAGESRLWDKTPVERALRRLVGKIRARAEGKEYDDPIDGSGLDQRAP